MIQTGRPPERLLAAPLPRSATSSPGLGNLQESYRPSGLEETGLMKPDFELMRKPKWPIPVADAQGDYQVRTYFDQWQVTDPTGLNVRIPAGFPIDFDGVDAPWPVHPDMSREETKLGTFPPGAALKPVMGNLGILYLNDKHGAPWMMVRGDDGNGRSLTGFVRSNMKHIQPQRPNGPIPLPDGKGDFRARSYYDRWQVNSTSELNVRMPAGFPEHPDSRLEDWPVLPDLSQEGSKLGSFPPGTHLTPVMGSRGIQYLYDLNGSPWMLVDGLDRQGDPLTGFVRSNLDYIHPRQD